MLKTILLVFQIMFSLGLIATILLQSGRSAGLSGVIAGGAQSLLGKKKGIDEFLNRISTVLAVGFLLLTLMVAIL
ncbi:MAG: preprotein translocase subunit SecG [Bacillota bacterium]|nr:preprotein translocase subunit SecG [Bacillota bacterium]